MAVIPTLRHHHRALADGVPIGKPNRPNGGLAFTAIIFFGIISLTGFSIGAVAQPAQGGFGKELIVRQDPGGSVRWILPGPRRLDPQLFGTPQHPAGFDSHIGVPLNNRLVSPDGRSFTYTARPTPFSDFYAFADGGFFARVADRTPVDTPQSQDRAILQAQFSNPDRSHQYRVVLNRLLNVGPHHPFFGGVLIDGFLHGKTGFGTRMQPTSRTLAALWGVGTLFVDGAMVANNRLVHLMTTARVRSPDRDGYQLLLDGEMDLAHGIHTHLLLPDMMVTANGPQSAPVPTGYQTPTGGVQPFIHVMFESTTIISISGSR